MRDFLYLPMAAEAKKPEPGRYTQEPSYEQCSSRPVIPPEGGAVKLRSTTLDEGVTFVEPIRRDWV